MVIVHVMEKARLAGSEYAHVSDFSLEGFLPLHSWRTEREGRAVILGVPLALFPCRCHMLWRHGFQLQLRCRLSILSPSANQVAMLMTSAADSSMPWACSRRLRQAQVLPVCFSKEVISTSPRTWKHHWACITGFSIHRLFYILFLTRIGLIIFYKSCKYPLSYEETLC